MAVQKQTGGARDANRDPISGEPGAHPVGVGAGAVMGGAAAGAAGGAAAGPIGAAAGAVIGGVAGGYLGKAAAEALDPTAEDAFWRENYRDSEYYQQGRDYSHYQPAYRYGWESRAALRGQSTFEEAEPELRRDWEYRKADSQMTWDEARLASRDAWNRVGLRYGGE